MWLVAPSPTGSGYRLELPEDPTTADVIAGRLGFDATSTAPKVPEEWLNLFPRGAALDEDSFGRTDVGSPVAYEGAETDLSRFSVGDLVRTPSRSYLLGPDGPIPRCTDLLSGSLLAPGMGLVRMPPSPKAKKLPSPNVQFAFSCRKVA